MNRALIGLKSSYSRVSSLCQISSLSVKPFWHDWVHIYDNSKMILFYVALCVIYLNGTIDIWIYSRNTKIKIRGHLRVMMWVIPFGDKYQQNEILFRY